MAQVDLNDTQIENALTDAFAESMNVLERKFQIEFRSVKWSWPLPAEVEEGATEGSPRDIIDTSLLSNSQLRTRISPRTYEWTWNREYALAVHNGATLKNNTVLPPRPWTEAPLKQLPGIYQKLATGALKGVK